MEINTGHLFQKTHTKPMKLFNKNKVHTVTIVCKYQGNIN